MYFVRKMSSLKFMLFIFFIEGNILEFFFYNSKVAYKLSFWELNLKSIKPKFNYFLILKFK